MRNHHVFAFRFALVWAIVLAGFISAASQKSFVTKESIKEELRPFDFTNEVYYENGIAPERILNRHNGRFPSSVFDTPDDERRNNVRILETFPAYDQNGGTIFWNLYGDMFSTGFLDDKAGLIARDRAERYPIYIFPSQTTEDMYRQAPLFRLDDRYFDDNEIGIGLVLIVEYTHMVNSPWGHKILAQLAELNGISVDGTPIIKTYDQIEMLYRRELVSIRIKGFPWDTDTPYWIARALREPRMGAITADAYLVNNWKVKAEIGFLFDFQCLQNTGRLCNEK